MLPSEVDGTRDNHASVAVDSSSGAFQDLENGQMSQANITGNVSKSKLAKMRSDFVQEMRLLSTLRHPNVTTVMVSSSKRNQLRAHWQLKGAIVQGSDPLLIMEFMDHGSLYDIIHNESM